MAKAPFKVKFQHRQKIWEVWNEPRFFEANVIVDYNVDKNYAADADNKGGIERLFIDDIKIESVLDDQCKLLRLPVSDEIEDDIWSKVIEDFVVPA